MRRSGSSKPFVPPDTPTSPDEEVAKAMALLDGASNADLELLGRIRPDLKKQLDLYKGLRSQRITKEAQLRGSLNAEDPERFIWEVLGWRPTSTAQAYGVRHCITPDQQAVLRSLRDNRRTAVPSGNGAGKTKIAAAAVIWFLNRYPDSIVITTASTWTLVEAQLWREIRAAFIGSKLPLAGKLMQTELRISDKHYAIGISTDDVSRFQGFHAPHVLVIIDEATGVREEIWEGASAITVGRDDRLLALGNPTDPASQFARVCQSSQWNVVRIDCRNHPNYLYDDPGVIPGAVTKEWVNDVMEECGGNEDHPLFRARVAGFFPAQGQDTLISLSDVQKAQQWDETHTPFADTTGTGVQDRPITHQGKGVALGLDIAGPGSDLCCLWSICDGRAKLEWWTIHTEIMETAGKVVRTIRDYNGRVKALALDDNGIGNGVGSRLLELQRWERQQLTVNGNSSDGHLLTCNILRCVGGASPHNEDKYVRLKDEAWWELAEALRKGILGLPPEPELKAALLPKGNSLAAQLTTPIYELSSNGKIRVYDRRDPNSEKVRLRALPTKSPDLAHSLMLARRAWKALQAHWDDQSPKTIHEAIKHRFKETIRSLRLHPGKKDETQGPDEYDYV